MFLLMLTNVLFLARQGLTLRGDGSECNSNFTQLIHLRRNECAGIDVNAWLDRRANKYTSPELLNECLQLMSLHILRKVSKAMSTEYDHTFVGGRGGGMGHGAHSRLFCPTNQNWAATGLSYTYKL